MDKKTLGQLVYEQRQAHGYSQFQLGQLIGVTDKAVSKWENDEACPRFEHCIRLAAILEISFDELITVRSNSADTKDKQKGYKNG